MNRVVPGLIAFPKHISRRLNSISASQNRFLSNGLAPSRQIVDPSAGARLSTLADLTRKSTFINPKTPLVPSKAYQTNGRYPNAAPMVITFGFGDSGAGGAIFAIHVYEAAVKYLSDLGVAYHVEFKFVHLGDAHNAPYGNKSFIEIQNCTKGLVDYLSKEHGALFSVLACNTASTTVNKEFGKWKAEHHPDSEVVPIIKYSARSLYNQADQIAKSKAKQDRHAGILATPATIKSQAYQHAMASMHREQYGNEALTVIINNDHRIDPEFKLPRVYAGSMPLAPGSSNEVSALRQIRVGESRVPNLFVHAHAPKDWVSIMEGKSPGNLTFEVIRELNLMFDSARDNKVMATDIKNMDVLGLFCTHYPYMQSHIETELSEKQISGVRIVTQGATIFNEVIKPGLDRLIMSGAVSPRNIEIPKHELFKDRRVFPFLSETTVDQSLKSDRESAEVIKKVCSEINPIIAADIDFSQIAPIKVNAPV